MHELKQDDASSLVTLSGPGPESHQGLGMTQDALDGKGDD